MKVNLTKKWAMVVAINLAASVTIAQTSEQQSQPGAGQQSPQSVGQQAQQSATAQQGMPKAKQFVKQTVLANKLELTLGQLAQEKAQDPQVKQFAQQLIQAHQKANQQLQLISDKKGAQMDLLKFEQLVQATGQQFDQNYLHYTTREGNEKVQRLKQIASQHPDPRIKQFAQRQANQMQQHIQQAQHAQTQIQASGRIDESAGAQPQEQQQQREQDVSDPDMPEVRDFAKNGVAGAKLGIALNALASEKAQSDQVRQLAQQQQQQSIQQSSQQLRQLAQEQGIQADMQPLQQLAKASGREFDKAYLRLISQEHRQGVIDLQQAASQQDSDIKQYASQQVPEMLRHLQQAQRLQNQIQSGRSIQEPAGTERDQEQNK